MDGFTVYYHWKHGNGWFYCILSLETWKRMVLLYWNMEIGNGLPGDAACEQTKEII